MGVESMNVIPIGDFAFRKVTRTRTVRCPICRRRSLVEDQRESMIKVVRDGKIVGKIRSILAECCSTEYVVSE